MDVNLTDHARRELDLLGEDPALSACLTATVAAYASFGHSGGSHEATLPVLVDLLNWRPLTPLSVDPDEWIDRSQISGVPMWQNERDSRAFSEDGGRTYTLIDDITNMVYTSGPPIPWVRALQAAHPDTSAGEALEVARKYAAAGPIDDVDQAALDAGTDAERERYLRRRWPGPAAQLARLLYQPGQPAAPAVGA